MTNLLKTRQYFPTFVIGIHMYMSERRSVAAGAKAKLKALCAAEVPDVAALTNAIEEARLAGVAAHLLRAARSRLREQAHAASTPDRSERDQEKLRMSCSGPAGGQCAVTRAAKSLTRRPCLRSWGELCAVLMWFCMWWVEL